MKKIGQNAMMGVAIGSTIYLTMGLVFTSGQVRINSLLIVLMGLVIGGLSTIYDSEKGSLLMKTLCQVIGSYLIFLVAAYWGNWFPFQLGIMVTSSLMFFGIFFTIWTLFYLREKKELEKINQQLKKS